MNVLFIYELPLLPDNAEPDVVTVLHGCKYITPADKVHSNRIEWQVIIYDGAPYRVQSAAYSQYKVYS